MSEKKKKQLFVLIIFVATIILITVGSTFAYFSATVSSEENVVSMTAAVFKVEMLDDTSLIKTKLIPSKEKYVDSATIDRLDANGDFVQPYEENGEEVIDKTACIDDNLYEICSIYTFTILNPMTTNELPVYVTLNPTINSFKNLHFKVVDEEKKIVMNKTRIEDDRKYKYDANGNKVYEAGAKISPIALTGINVTLPKATKNEATGEIVPSQATYSIILWIDETGQDQTIEDASQVFAGTVTIQSSGINGGGITGMLTAGGEE